MFLTIAELQKNIKSRFENENASIYFGLGKTEYIYKFDRLVIEVGHYRNKIESGYKLTFDEVVSCRITEESYIHVFKEEIHEGFSFFWQVVNSRFKKDFNSWSTYEGIYGSEQYNNLKSYRIVAQNNFVDILTINEPKIELIEC